MSNPELPAASPGEPRSAGCPPLPPEWSGQDLYRLIVEAANEGIWVIDPAGRTTYVNQRLAEMMGYAPQEMVGRSVNEFVDPAEWEETGRHLARRAAGVRERRNLCLKRRDGSDLWVIVSASPIFSPDGQHVGGLGMVVDISERRSATEAMRASEARLRLLVEQLPAVVWATDRQLRFTSSEGRGLLTLGLQPGQVVGKRLQDYFGSSDPSFPPLAASFSALSGIAASYQFRWQERAFDCHVEPLRQAGQIIGTIGVAWDTTQRVSAEQALRDAHDQLEARVQARTAELEQANRSLRQEVGLRREAEAALMERERHARELADTNRRLLHELDHRVRNNLAGLLGLVGLMRHRLDDVDAFADAIERRLQAMVQVHQLLAERNWGPLDLGELVRSLLAQMANLVPHRAKVEAQGPAAEIAGWRTLPLAMVLLEWFTNSCKYGAHSLAGGTVSIDWHVQSDAVPPRICLSWRERGGPPIRGPIVESLGTQLVRSFVGLELRGSCQLRYPPTGAEHEIEFPL